jgi:hypothetical protein
LAGRREGMQTDTDTQEGMQEGRQIDRLTERQADGQQPGRQTDRPTSRQAGRQRHACQHRVGRKRVEARAYPSWQHGRTPSGFDLCPSPACPEELSGHS